jgi:membrane-associated phospholipid phosphatase
MHDPRIRHRVGLVALFALVLETCLLRGTLEWFDVYVSSIARELCDGKFARFAVHSTIAAPWVGAALVTVAVLVALWAGTDVREIGSILVQLAVGLLLAGVVKVVFERARPGDLPWDLAGDSFPSGHVANAVLCVGTSVRLVRRGKDRSGALLPLVFVTVGLAFVAIVSVSRLVLARHWMTDVVGSLLLGTALLALAPMPERAATRRLLVATPLILLFALVASATGSRIRLPSPSTPAGASATGWQANEDCLGAMEIDYAGAPSARASGRFTLLSPTYAKQRVDVHDGHSPILKLLARPHFDVAGIASQELQLLVDGAVVGTQPLGSGWQMLAFALPTLTPGPHDFELRPRDVAW